LMTYPEPDLNL